MVSSSLPDQYDEKINIIFTTTSLVRLSLEMGVSASMKDGGLNGSFRFNQRWRLVDESPRSGQVSSMGRHVGRQGHLVLENLQHRDIINQFL